MPREGLRFKKELGSSDNTDSIHVARLPNGGTVRVISLFNSTPDVFDHCTYVFEVPGERKVELSIDGREADLRGAITQDLGENYGDLMRNATGIPDRFKKAFTDYLENKL